MTQHTLAMRRAALACLLLAGLACGACSKPGLIERDCIKGRLSSEQADAINSREWQHVPTYNRGPDGDCKNCAAVGDRVLAARCSDELKKLTRDAR